MQQKHFKMNKYLDILDIQDHFWSGLEKNLSQWTKQWEEKQLYGRFKWLISKISHEKTRTWLKKKK